jgi:hypothetical protein
VIRFFSGANPLNLLVLFFLGVLLRINTFTNPLPPLTHESDGLLYGKLLSFLETHFKNFPIVYPVISYLLLYMQAVALNAYSNQKKAYPSLNLLTAFSVVYLSALIPEWGQFSPILLVNIIFVWIWPRLTNLYHSEKVMSDVFNIGFSVGISAFIYFPAIYFFPLILLALLISRPFRLTEWVVALIGLFLPFYFFFIIQYFLEYKVELSVLFKNASWHIPLTSSSDFKVWIQFLLVFIPLLAGFIYNRMAIPRMVVHTRKIWTLNGLFLVSALILMFVNGNSKSTTVSFLPAVFFVTSFYALNKSKFFQELSVWAGLVWIITRNFF